MSLPLRSLTKSISAGHARQRAMLRHLWSHRRAPGAPELLDRFDLLARVLERGDREPDAERGERAGQERLAHVLDRLEGLLLGLGHGHSSSPRTGPQSAGTGQVSLVVWHRQVGACSARVWPSGGTSIVTVSPQPSHRPRALTRRSRRRRPARPRRARPAPAAPPPAPGAPPPPPAPRRRR